MNLKKNIIRILKEEEDISMSENYQEILEHNRQLEFLKKHADTVMEYLGDVVKEYNVYKLDYKIGKVWKGSWDWNKPFDSFIIELKFIDLHPNQRYAVKNEVTKMFKNLFNIDYMRYVSPLEVKFINYTSHAF